jgi:hypothetical protein
MSDIQKAVTAGELLTQLTKGEEFVFLVTPFDGFELLSNILKTQIEEKARFRCLRADDLHAAGSDLVDNVHTFIEQAALVVAVLTNKRPNVFYEVGYAIAKNKHVVMLVDKAEEAKVAADLRNRVHITYEIVEGPPPSVRFNSEPFKHVEFLGRQKREMEPLEKMLVAAERAPCIIVATPARRPDEDVALSPGHTHPLERTWGDNLGVIGLASALGNVLGESADLALFPAKNHFPNLKDRPANLYLIGSGKVNPLAEEMLDRLQAGRAPHFRIASVAGEASDHRVLSWAAGQSRESLPCQWRDRDRDGKSVPYVDYGIIVRGPHPEHPRHLVMVAAGSHSLGTGAACMAATQSDLVRQVIGRFPDRVMPGPERTVWVLVRGTLRSTDAFLDASGVEIVDVGVYEQPTR